MKKHVKMEDVRSWLDMLEAGQVDEVCGLMLAELELVGMNRVDEFLQGGPVSLAPEAAPAVEEAVDPGAVEAAKSELKKRGHSYKSAGEVLGVHLQRVYKVLNGRETSARILEGIFTLPVREPKAYVIKRGDYPALKGKVSK